MMRAHPRFRRFLSGTRPLLRRLRAWFHRPRMAISSTTSELSFTGNNSDSTAYALTGLRYDAATWLTVVQIDSSGDETTLTDGVEYNLGGTGSTGAGTLTSTTGNEIPATDTLRVTRNVPLTQATELENDVPLDHDGIETALDKGAMIDQDLDRRIDDKIGALVTNASMTSGSYATSFGWAVGSGYAEATFGGVGGLTATGAAFTAKGTGVYAITINCIDAGESIIISADGSVSIGSTIAANFRTALGI